jgi:hypothetical protein
MPEGLFGFFELDDSGIVRYSRPISGRRVADDGAQLIGHNFFEQVGLQNGDDLKRYFRRFIHSHRAADSFTFDCLFSDEVVKARIVMTRAFQTEHFPPEGIVLMDIRSAAC